MTEITTASIKKRSSGDQIKVTCVATNIVNAYTWTVPHISIIEDWTPACTTAAAIGGTTATNVITFATGSTLAGKITVYGR